MRAPHRPSSPWPLAAALALPALLAACGPETDPYARTGTWQPTGVNATNLAAMVAQPSDLLRGRSARGNVAVQATVPVTRLWNGTPVPLPSTQSQSGASGPAAQPTGAPGSGQGGT